MDLDKKATSAREHKYDYTLHMKLSMLSSHSHNSHIFTVHICTVEYYLFVNEAQQTVTIYTSTNALARE